MIKKIVLCADDYSLTPSVSQGILDLVKRKKLSAVSCMTTTADWPAHGQWLLDHQDHIDIGLHFNLTEGMPLSAMKNLSSKPTFPSLNLLLLKSYLGSFTCEEVIVELEKQIEAFIEVIGKPPDFIDGHQHVHHLPIVREAVLHVYERYLRDHNGYIRNTANSLINCLKNPISFPKSLILAKTGANALKQKLVKQKIPHNKSFAGIYNFNRAAKYADIFPAFLAEIEEGGLIMCHPGLKTNDANDPIGKSRWYEYLYLNSEDFLKACEAHDVVIARFFRENRSFSQ